MVRAFALGLAVLFTPFTHAADPKPNVLVILADDLGFSDLGCYGGEIATPNLDTLAKDGLRFTQFYNTARCWPSRAALMTGYYAQQVRRDALPNLPGGAGGQRPAWAKLLPDYLAKVGYRSYHSGKWHIDGQPLQNGFARSYNLTDQNRFFSPQSHTEDDKPLPARTPDSGYYATTYIADHAIQCLKEHAKTAADSPFFSYVAFTAPHFPLQAPPADIAKYRDTYRGGWEKIRAERWKKLQDLGIATGTLSEVERDIGPPYHFPEQIKKFGAGEVNRPLPWESLTPEQQAFQAEKMAIHAAMVDRMDQEIGKLLQQVRAMGAWQNTLIVFLSDNGASAEMMVRGDGHDPEAAMGSQRTHLCLGPGWSTTANTPFRRHKTWVHEGGITTPFIVHWPKGITTPGELRHTPGHVIDLAPTVLSIVDSRPVTEWNPAAAPLLPGRNLLPAITADKPIERESLWWLHEGNRALRMGDWKIVAAKGEPWELYNLAADRAETTNLAAQHPDRVRDMIAVWDRHVAEFTAIASKDMPAQKPKAKKKKK